MYLFLVFYAKCKSDSSPRLQFNLQIECVISVFVNSLILIHKDELMYLWRYVCGGLTRGRLEPFQRNF